MSRRHCSGRSRHESHKIPWNPWNEIIKFSSACVCEAVGSLFLYILGHPHQKIKIWCLPRPYFYRSASAQFFFFGHLRDTLWRLRPQCVHRDEWERWKNRIYESHKQQTFFQLTLSLAQTSRKKIYRASLHCKANLRQSQSGCSRILCHRRKRGGGKLREERLVAPRGCGLTAFCRRTKDGLNPRMIDCPLPLPPGPLLAPCTSKKATCCSHPTEFLAR